MNRAAVFAHWDSENKIEDYVIFYLKELKKVTDCLVFVSDCSLEENERNKINKYADKIIAKPHGEYDFGSYKRGYEYLVENELLDSFDELIFANDSCFGPFFAFSELFNTMNKKKMDWWGVSENSVEVTPHVQSFFLVFKKNVFTNKAFSDFIFSIKKEDTKNNIIDNYEIGLSKHLLKSGFKYETYSKIRLNPTLSQKNFFQKEPLVLIKKTALQKLHSFLIKYVLKKINKNNYYPENCIIEYSSNKFKNKKIKDTIKAIRRLIISLKRKHGTIEFLGKVFKFRPL